MHLVNTNNLVSTNNQVNINTQVNNNRVNHNQDSHKLAKWLLAYKLVSTSKVRLQQLQLHLVLLQHLQLLPPQKLLRPNCK